MPKIKILVLSGGPGGEREVSLETGRMVAQNLNRKMFEVIEAELTRDLDFIFRKEKKRLGFLDGFKKMQSMKIDCVFPALHGEFGEDGQLQTVLEILKIPFVGSCSAASRKAMDKSISQAMFESAGFQVPKTFIIQSQDDWKAAQEFLKRKTTFVIKPLNGGSSVGVMITDSRKKIQERIFKDLKKNQILVLQEYLSGRELTCGVIEKNGKAIALIPTEIRPKSSKFFDYTAKYALGGSDEITPPNLPNSRINDLQRIALEAHKLLGCRGLSRTDFILSGNKLFILELNTLPGMTKTSLLPQGAAAIGIDFSELLTILVKSAIA